ncbi:MAG: translation elongation factor 4 [Lentisphaerae bacterium]|nr:translation elongation factor 4 [Lentisphaerota bacterium]
MNPLTYVRNFCIIAHIDHGKSTLADRMLLLTHTIEQRVFRDQVLDAMDLERERGITIKSHPVTMQYKAKDGTAYTFNLIDTPGHVDFTYEVSRSMAACEGALLLVDAGQGVEAQTVANSYLAIERGLEIIPVINKVDLPSANIPEIRKQIEDVLGIPAHDALLVSAKSGLGVEELMEAVVHRIPPPKLLGKPTETRGLVFDSVFDAFRGVVTYVRMMDGSLRAGDQARMMAGGKETEIKEVGVFCPKPTAVKELMAGNVGYFIGNLKEPADIRIGDTVTVRKREATDALPGFRDVRPMVFSGIYPVNSAEFEKFRDSLEKLRLNDSALTFHPESSLALGFGYRCGFLGLLHMEITQERLRREFDMDIINTHPGVVYRVHLKSGEVEEIDNPQRLPDPTRIDHIEEPMVKAFVICLNENIGDVLKLTMDRRGTVDRTESLDTRRVMLTCTIPLNEILVEFHDSLKSLSKGYASMDYELAGYREGDIVKLEILLNQEPVDAFASLVHRSKAVSRGRRMCEVLKDVIPPHMFAIPVQAALNKTIIARETIRAFRKDVTAKLYGGDVTRKRKLLEKQKEGKKRMKQFGSVNVPQKAFVEVLKSS